MPGTTVEYTIVVTNNGPSVATERRQVREFMADATGFNCQSFWSSIVAPPGVACPEFTFVEGWAGRRGRIHGTGLHHPIVGAAREPDVHVSLRDSRGFSGQSRSVDAGAVQRGAGRSPAVDSDLSNNFAVVQVVVTPQADIAVTKTGPAAVVAGTVFSYFVTVSNNGPSTATNVVVEDPTPAGLTFVGGSGPCASGFPCTIATLAPGEGQTTRIDLFVPIDYAGPPTFVNTASASSPVPDPVPGNNSGAVSTLVVPGQADLFVRKSGPPTVSPGQTIEYVVLVTNLGPGPAVDNHAGGRHSRQAPPS